MNTWTICQDDGDVEDAILFLLSRRHELSLPYAFETVIGSLYLSVTQGEFLLCRDECRRPVAVVVYTCGTDLGEYHDVENVEVLIAFADQEHRGTRLFARGLALLTDRVRAVGGSRVMFYTAPQPGYRKLFGKFAAYQDTMEKACGLLDCYSVQTNDLATFTATLCRQGTTIDGFSHR